MVLEVYNTVFSMLHRHLCDGDFRYDQTLGLSGGYIFNLKITGLGPGTYSLNFSAAGDPASHSVPFGVK